MLVPFIIIAFAAVALKWIESTKVEKVELTTPQLQENQQNWLTQNQHDVLSRQEKLEPVH